MPSNDFYPLPYVRQPLKRSRKSKPLSDGSRKPERSKKYLTWIRKQPCVITGSIINVEACHTGPHGLSQKSSDLTAIPLTRELHQLLKNSLHNLGPRRFEEVYQIKISAIVERLNREWEALHG